MASVILSCCVVNTNGGELLLSCLRAIERTVPAWLEHEVLVLDNASDDGSAEAVRALGRGIELIALEQRRGKAENDSTLLERARGRYCLLLNEDAELLDGAAAALVDALERDPLAGAAGALLVSPDGRPQPCAWALPGIAQALAGALFLHRRLTVQSGGSETRPVGFAQSSALLVRGTAAREIDYLDPAFFVYSDETDFCKRLWDVGWRVLHVPAARALHHEQLASDVVAAAPRIVEFHRNRDRYMRKHHGRIAAAIVRVLSAWPYAVRTAAALVLAGHDPRRYLLHARQALRPARGKGIRELAAAHNRSRAV